MNALNSPTPTNLHSSNLIPTASLPDPPGQEIDPTNRSTKRMKDDSSTMECSVSLNGETSTHAINDANMDNPTVTSSLLVANANVSSYRDMLLADSEEAQISVTYSPSCLHDISDSDSESDDEEGVASIYLSKEEKRRIRAPWVNALIVKAYGRNVGYKFLFPRVMAQWKPKQKMECIDLGCDFFLFRFQCKEDYNRAMYSGPWFAGPYFLSIRQWEPGFKPEKATFTTTAVWARLPALLIEFFDSLTLRRIGNQLGVLLRIDATTEKNSRGKYARLCVQVDLDRPLIHTVKIGKHRQPVLYETVADLCFKCGCIGHNAANCNSFEKQTHDNMDINEGPSINATENSSANPETEIPTGTNSDEKENTQEDSKYGPWMVVERKRSKNVKNNFNTGTGKSSGGAAQGQYNGRNSKPDNSNGHWQRQNTPPTSQKHKPINQEPKPRELFVFLKDIGIFLDWALYSILHFESIPTPENTPFPLTKGWHNIVSARYPLNPNHYTHLLMDQEDLLDLTEEEKEKMLKDLVEQEFKEAVETVERELLNQTPDPWITESMMRIIFESEMDFAKSIVIPQGIRETSVIGRFYNKQGEPTMIYSYAIMPDCHANTNIIWKDWKTGVTHTDPQTANQWWGYKPNCLSMIKILSRNCRGAARESFKRNCLNLIRDHKPLILFISEPRISGARARAVAWSFGFSDMYLVDTIGFAGGLWMLWNREDVSQTFPIGEQAIHAEIQVTHLNSTFNWFISGIYASPKLAKRKLLWDELSTLSSSINMPWSIIGDFNDVIAADEKFGGNPINLYRSRLYRECMNDCHMIDLGYIGAKFTWVNGNYNGILIRQRIDRAWGNDSFNLLFPDAKVFHLPRTSSDHNPILLELMPSAAGPINKPFRFEWCWFRHPDFKEFVHSLWHNFRENLASTITNFAISVKKWNVDVFGNVHIKKKNLTARLKGIERSLSINHNQFLVNLQKDLIEEFNGILKQEEDLWKLKSRIDWNVDGDKNTSFFHATTVIRRRRNKINSLKDISGNLVVDPSEIKRMISNHFLKLYTTSLSFSTLESNLFLPPGHKIDNSLASDLTACPTKNLIFKEISEVFLTKSIPEGWNDSLISLIPKTSNPELITQFRPIGLCNTPYKIVSKIIVNRIRPLLSEIIGPNQASFLPGRKSADNVILLQEIVHSFNKKSGKNGDMIIKLDLEKAYDRLEWNFIRNALMFFNFPPDLIQLIMNCISSVNLFMIVNGEKTDSFQPSRGIRQGDPLSPYIFIICIEYLSLLIRDKFDKGHWRTFKISRSGPPITHLFFADDLILCAKATLRNCILIREVLNTFCDVSGQLVNIDKSKILFSKNTNHVLRNVIADNFGFEAVDNIGNTLDKKKIHLINWETATCHKNSGGLGLKAAKPLNQTYMAKLGWQLLENKNNLPWTQALTSKYLSGNNPCKYGSPLWKGIMESSNSIDQGLRWVVKNGSKACFWTEDWTGHGILRSFFIGPFQQHDLNLKVKDMLDNHGYWKDEVLLFLPPDVVNIIKSTPLHRHCEAEDVLAWKFEANGEFSLSSAYQIAKNTPNSDAREWKWIWSSPTLPRIKSFIWLVAHNRLAVKELLVLRGIATSSTCHVCNDPLESVKHVLRGCKQAISIWRALKPPENIHQSFTSGLRDWLEFNMKHTDPAHFTIPWNILFSFAIWEIWKHINDNFFGKTLRSNNRILQSIFQQAAEFFASSDNANNKKLSYTKQIQWTPPPAGFLKMNTDGASHGNPGLAGAGGIIRDSQGLFVLGFQKRIGFATSTAVELWAIREELSLAKERNLNNIMLETDSQLAIDLLQNCFDPKHVLIVLLDDCRSLMAQLRIQTLQHTFREGNYCADKLAKASTLMDEDFIVFEQPPASISIDLFADVSGISFPRTCNIRDTHSCYEEGLVPNNDLYFFS
ncbi:reverse transcriptase [Corchorus capsularis]|uniref:Reverse transcriptase n=1 Tax=Corchorus capsularis TaxID=210143 RepID=A0A1R3KDU4_COCAP|nr:reverse transcriptase [Corchorus capsularis]